MHPRILFKAYPVWMQKTANSIAALIRYDKGKYGVRVIKPFEQWAKNRDAVEICFGVNSGSGSERQTPIERLGYQLVGGNFARPSDGVRTL
jgi:hypothetical protein